MEFFSKNETLINERLIQPIKTGEVVAIVGRSGSGKTRATEKWLSQHDPIAMMLTPQEIGQIFFTPFAAFVCAQHIVVDEIAQWEKNTFEMGVQDLASQALAQRKRVILISQDVATIKRMGVDDLVDYCVFLALNE